MILFYLPLMASLTPFNSPSPLLAHQYYHQPPATVDNPCNFVLTFTELSYSITKTPKSPKNKHHAENATRTLLDSISGEVKTGEVLAVLGPSGSGKTTLMDALANRIDKSSLRGSVTLNDENLHGRLLRAISAYVMQDDLLYPMLTVEETLAFAAEVRLPRAVSASKKRERVQALIDQLNLRSSAKTIIGDEGHRGVSGGERRRVSIGTCIVHDPVILFLDEPTSGLDSTSAFMVVQVLHRIARSGSIVIMSIHQPSYRILGLLDWLIVLTRGRPAYSGPPHGLPEFFKVFGNPIPDGENPVEFALDLVSWLEETAPDAVMTLVTLNAMNHEARRRTTRREPFLPLQYAVRNSISVGRLVSGAMMDATAAVPASYANPVWIEVMALTRRSMTNMWRNSKIYALSLAQVLVTGFILATNFWRLGHAPKDAYLRGVFFNTALSAIFMSTVDTLAVLIQERYIYQRETAYNAYRHSSYVIANAVTTFLPLFVLSLSLSAMTFFAVGLVGGTDGLVFFFLALLAAFWAGSGFVTFISGVFSHVVIGYTVAAASFSYFILLGGFFIHRSSIPDHWIWLHYMSLFKYCYEALMQNEFGGESSSRCFSRGMQVFDVTTMANLPTAKKQEVLAAVGKELGMLNFSEDACLITGSDVLHEQAIGQLSKWNCLLVMLAWGFFFRLLFYICLVFGSWYKRKR
ncbi:hypothetical protein Cni_G09397 [Canna indica]|uniref:ABC transporter domain-containing protein n=1 Tax=Canna indica TaxID=4628 RepID=A0AAQ3K292_9LILI|nr:hypothetical protein Cni_G09397 [Canna indica]